MQYVSNSPVKLRIWIDLKDCEYLTLYWEWLDCEYLTLNTVYCEYLTLYTVYCEYLTFPPSDILLKTFEEHKRIWKA